MPGYSRKHGHKFVPCRNCLDNLLRPVIGCFVINLDAVIVLFVLPMPECPLWSKLSV